MFVFKLRESRRLSLWAKSVIVSLCMLAACIGHATAASNVAAIESAVTAFQTIGTLRRETPINGDAIAAAYTGALQSLTQEIDTANALTLDSDVLAAIEEIKNDLEPRLAGQVIDKTLQRVFYQVIWNRIATIRDEFESAASTALIQMLDEAVAAFKAISGTVARANQVLAADRKFLEEGTNPGLDIIVNSSFERVRTALGKTNPTEDFANFGVERYVVRMSLARAYYIAVLREVSGIIENRNSDPETTAIEQKEGEIFYRIIESLIARDNPLGNQFIKAQLTGDASAVTADEIVSELSKGIIGRVKGEMNGQATSIGSDRAHAMAEAAGAAAFANILLPDIELRLGATVRGNLETAFNNLQSASSENSVTKSAEARQAIETILASYEDELNLASYSKTHGTEVVIDGALSAFQEIGALRREFPMNTDAIAVAYNGDLQLLTQIVDQIYGLAIDSDVVVAIEATRNAADSLFAAQVIDKSLQRVFALAVYNRITLVMDEFDDMSTDGLTLEWDRAYAAFQAIVGTAARENKVLTADKQSIQSGSNPDIDDQITLAFIQGRQALDKARVDDKTRLAIAREQVIIPLARSYLIGVLREVEGIIKDRDSDAISAKEKQIEGEYFYRTVEGFIAQDNPSGNDRIKTQFIGDLGNVVADQIVSDISRGIIGQINRNLGEVDAAINVDTDHAMIAAERVSLYAGIIIPDLAFRLDSLRRVQLENALQDLKEASASSNTDKATAARSVIVEVISAYQSELI
ncbi:MAG: hypothetical protein KIS65_07505 [Nitrosomonas sp.]|nr:hypothetical protein [Nitrosomonas sp.]